MADLYNLLEELEENEAYDDGKQDTRRLTVETAATERLSDEEYEEDHYENVATPAPEIPAVLLQQEENDEPTHLEKGLKDTFAEDRLEEFGKVEEDVVPNEIYAKLHQRWLQERHCPELLEYDEEMVQELQEKFEERQEQAEELVESQDPSEVLMANLAQQDLDRAKFVLSDWLTHRLHKIEAHPLHMREKIESMSQNEIDYLAAYGAMIHHHLEQTVTNSIPQAWKDLDDPEMIDEPDYEGYHFWFVREPIVDRDEIEHEAGSCLVAKYLDMKDNMNQNKVELLI